MDSIASVVLFLLMIVVFSMVLYATIVTASAIAFAVYWGTTAAYRITDKWTSSTSL